jgi:hypothetical protein
MPLRSRFTPSLPADQEREAAMQPIAVKNLLRGLVLTALALAVSACLLSPGKFTSDLNIRKDGTFTFAYAGEIHMLALSKLAAMGGKSDETFKPTPCYAEDGFEERPCTADETAKQKKEWQEAQTKSAESRRRDAESMKVMLGGIDPSDPRAAEEVAQRLRRQAGWRKVEYKGDGLFLVDFAIAGRLDHDFIFPTIERFPMANSFVLVAVRQDGTVRVDAAGFGPASSGEPYRGLMQLGAMAGSEDDKAKAMPGMPTPDGKFTIRTDGAVLANNTDEGPQADPAGQRLDWMVNARTPAAPTALIKLR